MSSLGKWIWPQWQPARTKSVTFLTSSLATRSYGLLSMTTRHPRQVESGLRHHVYLWRTALHLGTI
jgi:hypothetical protein